MANNVLLALPVNWAKTLAMKNPQAIAVNCSFSLRGRPFSSKSRP